MADLKIGLELLAIGMIIVFLVLLILMFIMQLMSKSIARLTPVSVIRNPAENGGTSTEEELAAVIAVIYKKVAPGKNYRITVRS